MVVDLATLEAHVTVRLMIRNLGVSDILNKIIQFGMYLRFLFFSTTLTKYEVFRRKGNT